MRYYPCQRDPPHGPHCWWTRPAGYRWCPGVTPPADEPDPEDHPFAARCDYCGTTFPVRQVCLYWIPTYTDDDQREVHTTGIYCSEPCADWSANRSGSTRG